MPVIAVEAVQISRAVASHVPVEIAPCPVAMRLFAILTVPQGIVC